MAHLIECDAGNKPSIFAVVAILVVADRTRDTGRFNLVQGALATAVGLGTALSTTFGGKLIQHFNYRISFLALGAIALFAFLLVATAIPETLADRSRKARQSGSGPSSTTLPQELPA